MWCKIQSFELGWKSYVELHTNALINLYYIPLSSIMYSLPLTNFSSSLPLPLLICLPFLPLSLSFSSSSFFTHSPSILPPLLLFLLLLIPLILPPPPLLFLYLSLFHFQLLFSLTHFLPQSFIHFIPCHPFHILFILSHPLFLPSDTNGVFVGGGGGGGKGREEEKVEYSLFLTSSLTWFSVHPVTN